MPDSTTTTRSRAIIDRVRTALEANGADPHLAEALPVPPPVSDLYELAIKAGCSVVEFVEL